MEKIERKIQTVDAAGKAIGRVASEVVRFLQGKHKPQYVPNVDVGDGVEVENIDKVKFTGKKLEQKEYIHHSGFLGGLKRTLMKDVWQGNKASVLRRAVKQMLPKNKLTPERMKRLVIK